MPEDDKFKVDKDEIKFLELLQKKLTTIYHYSPANLNINSQVIAVKSFDDHVLNTYINFEGVSYLSKAKYICSTCLFTYFIRMYLCT